MPRPDRGGQSPVGLAFPDLLGILRLCVTRKRSVKGKPGLCPHPHGSAQGAGQKAMEARPTPSPRGRRITWWGWGSLGRAGAACALPCWPALCSPPPCWGRGGSPPEDPHPAGLAPAELRVQRAVLTGAEAWGPLARTSVFRPLPRVLLFPPLGSSNLLGV